ncbi:TonB-dependent receptor [Flectobacillus roseus]|uniref:TonB-dependent receptor n=1 Tax=Flectobacillus roseus TaxID=502259 RepID=A0ABT6Y8U8_9BACT|nr:TonB-dependent receptor [Flectobacillus roseus]MDI9859998.1 TonB-dependent receptor [Flectobacillus roseus]
MKKNRQSKAFWLTIMRITGMQFFMILFLTSFAWAKTSAQEELNKKISISIDGIVLKSALQKIEKTAQIRISYNSQVVPLNRTVTLLASNERVGDVLERLLKPLSVTYVMFNNQIVLRKIETPSTTTNATETERENVVALPTVSGTITDEKGKALPGVNITIKGTTKGTNSDASGHFKIEVPTENTTLVFSYVGYVKQEVVVGNRTVFNISLALELQSLDEVVVVGYGTQSKRAVSGAVSSVGFKQFQDRSFSNVTQALSGQIAGVNISQSQGAPGVSPIIRIRGVSSITAGTNPLFVVDGVPLENFNLNMVNPQDIESVEVLKDASSAAIYGSRGANGVILVTTKLGKAGKTTFSVGYESGVQSVERRVKMMDAQQWINYYIDAHNNAWVDLNPAKNKASDPNSVRGSVYKIPDEFLTNPQQFGKGTDWQDVMFRVAPSQNAQFSASGGTDKTQFMFSAAYLNQDAVLDENYYKRLSLRSNIKHQLSNKFTIGLNLGVTGIFDRTDGTQGKSDVVSLGLQSDPIFPVYNENGNIGYRDPNSVWNKYVAYNDLNLCHPYSLTRYIHKQNKTFNTLATGFLEYKILDDLKFKTSISANLYNTRYNSYRVNKQGYGYSGILPAEGYSTSGYSLNWLSENTLNYDKSFGDHNLALLLGYSVQKQRNEFASITSGSFPNDLVETLNAGVVSGGFTNASEWAMISYLARAQYNYLNRYFFTAAIRRDGSSRFGANSRWGYFPSVSGAWVVSDENFMKDIRAINNLKFRVSYGMSGNNQIPNYGSTSLLSSSNYVSGSTLASGLAISNIANTNLQWERTTQFNLGLDLKLLNNRIGLSAEYYNSTTNDMLLNVPVPDITGFSTQLTNIGKMENKGVELNLNTQNVQTPKFSWSTDFNFSSNRNKVLQLGQNNAPITYTDFVVTVKTEVGQPISNFFGYVVDGVFKNQAQVDATPHYSTTKPGDPIIRDVNGDGKITVDDRTTLGNYQPDFMAGITNNFSYKGFDLSFMFQGSFGGEIVNQNFRYSGFWNNGRNMYAGVANRWRSESDPGDGTHFRATLGLTGLQDQFTSLWVEDASFVRLKNIRVSYTIPSSITQKLHLKTARVYVNAENVYLWSKYTNYDPENTTYNASNFSGEANGNSSSGLNASGNAPNGAFIGVDYGSYPIPRVITIGAKIDF